MKVIEARNVHEALPRGVAYLLEEGIQRESRNGPVLQAPGPVTTVYTHPNERVLFWGARDANPFFHLYESLWMLAGRNDVEGVARYASRMKTFSDDDKTFHGAYGYRWREQFDLYPGASSTVPPFGKPVYDQLAIIADALKENPEDRRQVLQMWAAPSDLGRKGKDLPCNVVATFQRDTKGRLDLTVFCRSNDIIWGCYGANAVHFSFLLEYMATRIGCPVGVYRQVSVNWHGYLDTVNQCRSILPDRMNYVMQPYDQEVYPIPLPPDHREFDGWLYPFLSEVDSGFAQGRLFAGHPFFAMCWTVLRTHHIYNTHPAPQRFELALEALHEEDGKADWVQAARQWVLRRELAWVDKNA